MKHIKTKIAAFACAAVTSVCAAQGLTASAANGSAPAGTIESQVSCQEQGYRMSDFLHSVGGHQFPAGRYWNSGNPDTCTTTYNTGKTTKVTVGQVCSAGFSTNLMGGPAAGAQIQRSAAFARKLASIYFGTDIYMRQGTYKNFTARLGDQITYYTGNGTQTHTVFVTGTNNNGDLTLAECEDNVGCKISYSGTCFFHNGAFIRNGKSYGLKYVERPVKIGDVDGNGFVDGNDCTRMIQVQNGTFNFSGINYNMMRAAADVDRDWQFYDQDDFNYVATHATAGGCLSGYGYVKALW
ncbi:MAG TPA: hypothetical protein DCG49_03445 [Ruminococcus sp.]|nr:hypothetical protein [Ruminococcus sp.]